MQDWVMQVMQLAIGVIIAVVSAIVATTLAFRRFKDEQWWERKASAYANAIEALHHLKRSLQEELTCLNRQKFHINLDGLLPYLEARFGKQLDGVHRAVDTAPFLLSEGAASDLDDFLVALARAETDNSDPVSPEWDSKARDALRATERCLQQMINRGRDDLGIKRRR